MERSRTGSTDASHVTASRCAERHTWLTPVIADCVDGMGDKHGELTSRCTILVALWLGTLKWE